MYSKYERALDAHRDAVLRVELKRRELKKAEEQLETLRRERQALELTPNTPVRHLALTEALRNAILATYGMDVTLGVMTVRSPLFWLRFTDVSARHLEALWSAMVIAGCPPKPTLTRETSLREIPYMPRSFVAAYESRYAGKLGEAMLYAFNEIKHEIGEHDWLEGHAILDYARHELDPIPVLT